MNLDAEFLNNLPANKIPQHIKKIIYHNKMGFILGMQGYFIYKSVNITLH